MTRLKAILLAMLRLLTHQDILHSGIAAASMWGLWCGLERLCGGCGTVAVSSLMLTGVVYARTRGQG